MKWITCLALATIVTAPVFADSGPSHVTTRKRETIKKEYDFVDRELFRDQETSVDIFGMYVDGDSFGRYKSGFGGGLGVNHFFMKYVGAGVEANWWEGDRPPSLDHEVVSTLSGSGILRWPIEKFHLAPYGFGGIGRHFSHVDQMSFHIGGGLEYRFTHHLGVFGDIRHVMPEDDNDFEALRMGVRWVF